MHATTRGVQFPLGPFLIPLRSARIVEFGDRRRWVEPEITNEVVAQLLAFVEQTTDFVGVSDPWGRILYLNPAARKHLGVDDARAVTIADLFPPESFAFYYDV